MIALLEKETVKKKRMKRNDHKRMPLLQFAELGLQKVGFGFKMGGGTNEPLIEGFGAKSDSSECEEEVVSLVAALKQELQKTKVALDISNGKLRLKEELAIAAKEATERSLQLADSGAVELRQWIKELTRQLEEAEKRECNSYKVRRICWPWQVFKLSFSNNIVNTRVGN